MDTVTFSSGRRAMAHNGIIGIDPDLTVFQGYDGVFEGSGVLTSSDIAELAALMIDRWTRLAARAAVGAVEIRPSEMD